MIDYTAYWFIFSYPMWKKKYKISTILTGIEITSNFIFYYIP